MKPTPIKPKKGQESVWDYPRPPLLETVQKQIQIYFNEVLIAESSNAYRVLETSHPPVYYLPLQDIDQRYLIRSEKTTYCEWKGKGSYYDVQVGNQTAYEAAWFYSEPKKGFEAIKNYPAFYAHKMSACMVDGEQVIPQPGNFYGGWITKNIVGPFKGVEGSWGW